MLDQLNKLLAISLYVWMHVFIYLGLVLYVRFSHLFKSYNFVLRVCKPLSYELRRMVVELLKCFFLFQESIVRL